jgi:hypothetical protein
MHTFYQFFARLSIAFREKLGGAANHAMRRATKMLVFS